MGEGETERGSLGLCCKGTYAGIPPHQAASLGTSAVFASHCSEFFSTVCLVPHSVITLISRQAVSGRAGVACAGQASGTPAPPQSSDRRPGRAVWGGKQLPSAARAGLSQSPDRRPGRAVSGRAGVACAGRLSGTPAPTRRPGRAVLGGNYEMFRRISPWLGNSRLLKMPALCRKASVVRRAHTSPPLSCPSPVRTGEGWPGPPGRGEGQWAPLPSRDRVEVDYAFTTTHTPNTLGANPRVSGPALSLRVPRAWDGFRIRGAAATACRLRKACKMRSSRRS
jgi:hypothetical protein